MTCVKEPLSSADIKQVLDRPNGAYALMELVRMGRIDSEAATKALDRYEKEPFLKRVALALVDAIFSR